MNWIAYWMILGTLWSWYAINNYYYHEKEKMSFVCEFSSIILNLLLYPVGLIFGLFFYVNISSRINESDMTQEIDGGLTIVKLFKRYEISD
jgi:hypothetical protein